MIAITAPWVTRWIACAYALRARRFFSVCSTFGIRRRRRIRFPQTAPQMGMSDEQEQAFEKSLWE
jgi:hypothetical protein